MHCEELSRAFLLVQPEHLWKLSWKNDSLRNCRSVIHVRGYLHTEVLKVQEQTEYVIVM